MPEHSYTSRAELDQYAFRPIVTVLAPLLCILLQAMLPKTWAKFNYVDLPLIATIFFAVARRNPITGTITGTLIGLLQDGLTNHPFGVYGIAKGVIGCRAACCTSSAGDFWPTQASIYSRSINSSALS
jgi:rod shape-determining protein MreD